MTTRRHPSSTGAAVVTAVVAALLIFAPAFLISAAADSGPGSSQAGDATAQDRLDADRALAASTAEHLSAARSEQLDLEEAIAKGEAAIPALRTRADGLRAAVRERAARLYMRVATPRLDAVVRTDNVIDAERAAHVLLVQLGDLARHAGGAHVFL
jgi:hypothetical protein